MQIYKIKSLLYTIPFTLIINANAINKDVNKLVPKVRDTQISQITNKEHFIQIDDFSSHIFLMEEDEFNNSANLISKQDNESEYLGNEYIYTSEHVGKEDEEACIFGKIGLVTDPDNGEKLGIIARCNAIAMINMQEKTPTVHITKIFNIIDINNKILPRQNIIENKIRLQYNTGFYGKIASINEDAIFATTGDSVAINIGSNKHIQTGQVLKIYPNENTKTESLGEMVVYKVYSKMAFGLITNAIGPINVKMIVKYE